MGYVLSVDGWDLIGGREQFGLDETTAPAPIFDEAKSEWVFPQKIKEPEVQEPEEIEEEREIESPKQTQQSTNTKVNMDLVRKYHYLIERAEVVNDLISELITENNNIKRSLDAHQPLCPFGLNSGILEPILALRPGRCRIGFLKTFLRPVDKIFHPTVLYYRLLGEGPLF